MSYAYATGPGDYEYAPPVFGHPLDPRAPDDDGWDEEITEDNEDEQEEF